MNDAVGFRPGLTAAMLLAISLLLGGCHCPAPGSMVWAPKKSCLDPKVPAPPADMPRELNKVVMPEYIIEAPDILQIDAVRVVPKPPYKVESLDVLSIQVTGTLPEAPIDGNYGVEPGGTVNLGLPYGAVRIVGMTIEEANETVRTHLLNYLTEPQVVISLIQGAAQQQIAGQHLVAMDGRVTLGSYGRVYVTGMTLDQAREAIEEFLSQHLEEPEIALDVYAYNSKVYYVVTEGGGLGDAVYKLPITGNETVLDAIAEINGMESVSSKRIWISRPAPFGTGCDQVLPVDWYAITERAGTATNYQLLPGDRLFIAEDRLVAADTLISKITAPLERIAGFALLGGRTGQFYKFFNRNQGFGNTGVGILP